MRKPLDREIRQRIFKRDGYRCRYCGCGSRDDYMHVDHVVPVSRGGTDHDYNLVTSCAACNLEKRTKLRKHPGIGVSPVGAGPEPHEYINRLARLFGRPYLSELFSILDKFNGDWRPMYGEAALCNTMPEFRERIKNRLDASA